MIPDIARVYLYGRENLPQRASLFLPNRVDEATLRELEAALGGAAGTVYMVEEDLLPEEKIMRRLPAERVVKFHFRSTQSRMLRERLMEHLQAGRHIVFLPGKPVSIMGSMSDVPKPFLMQLGALHISPVPVFVGFYRDSIWQSFTREARYDYACVRILPKLQPGPQSGERTLEAWLAASASEYEHHPVLNKSVGRLLVEGMKSHPDSELIDGMDDSHISFTKLLGAALALARDLKHRVTEGRLGVILPPGKGGVIANYACILAGIVPVNINYTSSEATFHSIVRQSGIRHFLTARAFMIKLPQFPWPEESSLLHLDVLLRNIGMAKIAGWVAFARMAPAGVIVRTFGLDRSHGEDEAALLFTSGSSGEPKGVSFTHRMIVANMCQVLSRAWLPSGSRFLCSLPIFHSFGLTISTLLPAVYGFSMVTYPSPLEAKTLDELVEKHECRLIITTPTFARSMLRRAHEHTFDSVKYFVVGAEKLQESLANEFRAKCGVELLEGYGLTETSPVCAVNLPDAPAEAGRPYFVPAVRYGTVGQLLPGMAVRITDPDDDTRAFPLTEQGMIWVKGANVFRGYIGREEANAELFRDGWFKTGDLGCVDLNGFLTLGGRRSRFSKVGGEMVPHEVVESAIEAFVAPAHEEALPGSAGRCVAIVGVPDAQKGEALVLLSSVHHGQLSQALDAIRAHLAEIGLPRLWSPREIIPVESIPLLPTGKLDLRGCQMLAQEGISDLRLTMDD